LHESFIESPIDFPKLNHEGDANIFVLFFYLFISFSFEDFDANVFALHLFFKMFVAMRLLLL
jgi:hypothetical protein